MAGKTGSVLVVEAGQVAMICALGLALGWKPHGEPVLVLALLLLGTAAFAGLALVLAGALRAEATLALANLVFLLLLLGSGMAFPLTDVPAGVRSVLELLPSTALAQGLRTVFAAGGAVPVKSFVVLLVWAVGACGTALATFRWD